VGTSAGVPLNVGGTVDAPLLYPTAGTMAGAAFIVARRAVIPYKVIMKLARSAGLR
jgi:hypothetical protein